MENHEIRLDETQISNDDLRQKMDELSAVFFDTLVEHKSRRYVVAALSTVAAVWLAYRYGIRRGRKGG